MEDLNKITKKKLLDLPVNKYGVKAKADYVILVPTNDRHDSNFNTFAVVYFDRDLQQLRIHGYSDVIYKNYRDKSEVRIKIDVLHRSKCARFFPGELTFNGYMELEESYDSQLYRIVE